MRLQTTLRVLQTSIVICGLLPYLAHAQVVPETQETSAVITGPSDSAVGRTVILDASASRVKGERVEYRWTIVERKQLIGKSVEAIFTPDRTGVFTFRLTIKSTGLDGKVETSETTHRVVIYRRKIVVIADQSISPEKLQGHVDRALEVGVYLRVVQPDPSTQTLGIEDAITSLLTEKKDILSNAESIVVWTDGISGLQALLRSVKTDTDKVSQVKNSALVIITRSGLKSLERTVRGSFAELSPLEIIMTRSLAINPIIEAKNVDEFKTLLSEQDIEAVTIVSATYSLRPWNVISSLVNYLLARGVSSNTVILLLMLPVIATIFTFLKQVIGITTFGLYTPSIIALSFLSLGWWTGLLILLFILITGHATRSLVNRWRLLYIPKSAIILTVLAFSLLILIGLGTAFGISYNRDTVFMLLILSTLAENYLSLKSEEGWRSAALGMSETVLGALLCIAVVQWQALQSLILAYPELILLTLLINIFLGRWTGLRLIEYFRFREVFNHLQEE